MLVLGCGGHGATRKVDVGTTDTLVVRATRACAGTRGDAELSGRTGSRFTPARHAEATAALAFLHAAEALLADGRAADARACARTGLETLGDRYEDPAVIDDTTLKLAAADERAEAGALEDAASVTLRVLDDRLDTYLHRWRAELDAPAEQGTPATPEEP